MKAIDTNILVYARREECEQHPKAKALLVELSEDPRPWAIPWPCLYEFLRVVTHPKIFNPPSLMENVIEDLESLLQSPSLVLLRETERHPNVLKNLLSKSKVTGNLVHDAHIAALLVEHGVRDLITADDDFRRFEEIKMINPFR